MRVTARPLAPGAIRVLGIDPGLRRTGFGVIDRIGTRLSYVGSGVISVPDGELPQRLATLFARVSELLRLYQPRQCVIEKVFVNVNPHSTLLLGQARGAAIAALASSGLPVAEYTALQVKQSVVGYGRANKEQVQHMITRLLSLTAAPSKDAADALACAVCHAHGSSTVGAIGTLPPALTRRGLRVKRGRLVPS